MSKKAEPNNVQVVMGALYNLNQRLKRPISSQEVYETIEGDYDDLTLAQVGQILRQRAVGNKQNGYLHPDLNPRKSVTTTEADDTSPTGFFNYRDCTEAVPDFERKKPAFDVRLYVTPALCRVTKVWVKPENGTVFLPVPLSGPHDLYLGDAVQKSARQTLVPNIAEVKVRLAGEPEAVCKIYQVPRPHNVTFVPNRDEE